MIRWALVSIFLAQAAAVAAQTPSAADIRALVDQRVSGLDAYRELLADPDEVRAVAAMEIMMAADDPALRRMALEFGLFSPAPAVRSAALDAYFSSGPTLGLRLTPDENANAGYFRNDIAEYSGSIQADGTAFVPVTVGPADPGRRCYLDAAGADCVIRNTDSEVSLLLWGNWWKLDMDAEGQLVGSGNSRRGTLMSAVVPVSF